MSDTMNTNASSSTVSKTRRRAGRGAPTPVRGQQPGSGGVQGTALAMQQAVGNHAVGQMLGAQQAPMAPGRRKELRSNAPMSVTKPRLNILKVTVAGSGDKVWKTHKGLPAEKTWTPIKSIDGMKSYQKYKGRPDGTQDHDLCFSGPLGWGGAKDSGSNSIDKLITYVPDRVVEAVDLVRQDMTNTDPIHIVLRAHSRGAVAGSHIANALAQRGLVDNAGNPVQIEVVLFDPVPGPGHKEALTKVGLDPRLVQTTVVYSVKSGYSHFFDPAQVLGAKRIIITGQPHSAGIKEGFNYKGVIYRGSRLSTLEPGVYVERSTMLGLPSKVAKKKAPAVQGRAGVIRKAADITAAQRRMKRLTEKSQQSGKSDDRLETIRSVLDSYFENFSEPEARGPGEEI